MSMANDSFDSLKLGFRCSLAQLAELHGEIHVALDLELARHKRRLPVELARHQLDKVLLGHQHRAVDFAVLALLHAAAAVLQVDGPVVLAVDREQIDAVAEEKEKEKKCEKKGLSGCAEGVHLLDHAGVGFETSSQFVKHFLSSHRWGFTRL